MLKELYIENLAVIEKASVSFGDKLNVFSGETGAGKSILIGGINAVLGGRTGRDIVRTGETKAVVAALFDKIPKTSEEKLAENGYNYDGELLLQREIFADGRSVARINGKLSTAAVLKEIAADLIDIHGQHDTAILMSTDAQREILDSYAGLNDKLEDYKASFRAFSHISREIKALQKEISEKEARAKELSAKIEEIESFKLKPNEEEETKKKLEAARSRELIQSSLSRAHGNLSGFEDGNALDLIRNALRELEKISEMVSGADTLSQRLSGIMIDIEDISSELSAKMSDDYSEESLSELENRMSDILLLKRRFGMETDEMIKSLADWKNELERLRDSDDILEEMTEKRRKLADEVKTKALEISGLRKDAAQRLVKEITEQLVFLDMPNVEFVFDFKQDKITLTGMDSVEMLISVNKGEAPKPMNKTASGGELSRIMLAVKNVLASADEIPTMIFDEIDTGISGRAAQRVGIKLSEIAQKRQVLCVTHLAQIAAQGDTHFLIEKQSDDTRTYTGIKSLDFEQRKREIARIISGDPESEIALKNAEELLKRKNRFD